MQYAHGGDIYTYKNLLDFSINVNPLGPADAVVEAAARSLQRIGEYPDSQSRELRNALAEKKGLAAEQFVIGNGAADLFTGTGRKTSKSNDRDTGIFRI